jgi:RNA polymerase sigma-70 factor (ECF subfamily)
MIVATEVDDEYERTIADEVRAQGPLRVDAVRFDAVYRETSPLVFRALRRLVPESCIDDAVQDVFLVVARRLDEFEGRSKASTWVYGIVLRVAADHRRAHKRRKRREQALAMEPEPEPVASPEAAHRDAEARRILHSILDAMDDELREVFVLTEIEQLPGPEIASLLGLNPNTMYSRLRTARAEFEAIMKRMRAMEART